MSDLKTFQGNNQVPWPVSGPDFGQHPEENNSFMICCYSLLVEKDQPAVDPITVCTSTACPFNDTGLSYLILVLFFPGLPMGKSVSSFCSPLAERKSWSTTKVTKATEKKKKGFLYCFSFLQKEWFNKFCTDLVETFHESTRIEEKPDRITGVCLSRSLKHIKHCSFFPLFFTGRQICDYGFVARMSFYEMCLLEWSRWWCCCVRPAGITVTLHP